MSLPAADLILSNATVIDGARTPRYTADVAIQGKRILAVGNLTDYPSARRVDLTGKMVAPGFIDAHTHDDLALLRQPSLPAKLSQGITTVITGNCGVSIAPLTFEGRSPPPPMDLFDPSGEAFQFAAFADYVAALEQSPAALNAALLVGHTTLRLQAMQDVSKTATADEIRVMRDGVEKALQAGAIGVSTGLFYEPAFAATTEEVIEVCRPMSEQGGLYCTHMRNEAEGVIDSLEETFRIGKELGVPVVVSHHKIMGRPNFGRSAQTLSLIAERMKHQKICLDCYPYAASSTILSHSRARIANKVLITWSRPHPEFNGMDLASVQKQWGLSLEETIGRLLPAGAIYFSMDEADVQQILRFEHTMIGSDGLPHDARPHPRLWGTFPRVLGHYSRGLGLFPLETAVWKMTGLTAQNFGLIDRGVIREGAYADLTVFDPETVADQASFDEPERPASGIEQVYVNGVLSWADGRATGSRSGQVIRRS
jgi:N-acyl-D-amino-acid deacylase